MIVCILYAVSIDTRTDSLLKSQVQLVRKTN